MGLGLNELTRTQVEIPHSVPLRMVVPANELERFLLRRGNMYMPCKAGKSYHL